MQALVYSRVLPSGHRFFRSASSCSELVTTKLAVSYPNIICVLVDLHGVNVSHCALRVKCRRFDSILVPAGHF
jgi:hypothetical protein